ncbi:MAG: energy-coupling factor transporter transmembrane component T [Nitrospirota bacterium]
MEIPFWLTNQTTHEPQKRRKGIFALLKSSKRNERFIDRTLIYATAFLKDTMFNESVSTKKGLLQSIEAGLKLISLSVIIIAISFQKSIDGIVLFLPFTFLIAFASRVPLQSLIMKVLPAAVLTLFIALPATLNIIVDGKPFFVLFTLNKPFNIGPVTIPERITITVQGIESAFTLTLRVIASVSVAFLMTMTTTPNKLIKAVSSLIPGTLGNIASISYRYIFLLLRRVEQFVMALKSRRINSIEASAGRRWSASRISHLFFVSMTLTNELAMAMESRGYVQGEFKVQSSKFKVQDFSGLDILWLLATTLFAGVMIWKSFR